VNLAKQPNLNDKVVLKMIKFSCLK